MTGVKGMRAGYYSDEVKHAAFLAWFKNGRDITRTIDQLAKDELVREMAGLTAGDEGPNRATVYRWSREDFWEIKAENAMKELAPSSIRNAALEVAYAQADAARTLTRIARGEVQQGDKLALDASKHLLSMGVGDSVVHLARPTVTESIGDLSDITDMEELTRRERQLTDQVSD